MSDPAGRFEAETDALSDVRLAEAGEHLHEYTGVLAETDERVRILTLATELAEIDAAVDAFGRVSDQWYNASANANIRPIRERGTDPRRWIALPDDNAETLATVQPDLSPDAIETVIAETADALRTLGLYNTVHGHLSPDDIYVTNVDDAPEELTVEVGGFGLEAAIRAAIDEAEPTAYTAPELLDGSKQSSEQTDVYGLGAVTYFALAGKAPIAGSDLPKAISDGPTNPPSTYAGGMPADVDNVVMHAVSTSPADRYESPYQFHRAFFNVFDPADPRLDDTSEDGENKTETAGSDESADTMSAEGEVADSMDSEAIDETSVTRRAAVGLLGMGVVGSAGWYLFGGQLTADDPADETAADPADEAADDPTEEPPTPDPPTELSASILITPADPSVGDEVTFSATESTTGEGVSLETYEWAVGTDTEFSVGEETLTQSFSESGEKTVRLRIGDSQDRTATAVATLTVEGVADGSPMFRYDAANTGASPDETGPQTSIGEQWSFQTGDGVGSSPAVVDGTVYIGSRDNNVYALSADDGTEQWSFQTGESVDSSPAVVDGTVYVGSDDNNVYALSADDGTEQWSFGTGRYVNSSPTVVDGTVYVGTNRDRYDPQYRRDGQVHALSADGGFEQWTFRTGDTVRSVPAVVDGTVYVGSRDDNVYALSADDGSEQWSFQTGSWVFSSPAVVDGTVYIGSFDDDVYALSADGGTEQWAFQTGESVASSPTVVDGTVYVGSADGNVYSLSEQ